MSIEVTLSNHGGAETTPTHGLVDVAAGLASDAWNDTQASHAVGELHMAIEDHIPYELTDAVAYVAHANVEAVRYGARLGFALASTSLGAEKGWEAWRAAAKEWLGQTNCSAAEHHDSLIEHCTAEAKKLSK
jgi:hypothetical protein